MKALSIDDFTPGRNTLDSQLLLGNGECVATSQNVWAPTRSLTKMPGTTLLYSFTSTAAVNNVVSIYQDDTVTTASQLYYGISVSGAASNVGFFHTGESSALSALGYTTGTVAVANSSISATGIGTTWLTHVASGSAGALGSSYRFTRDSGTTWYPISSVEDDTHLTLSVAFAGSASTGTYLINPSLTETNPTWASLRGSWWACTTGDVLHRYDGVGMTQVNSAQKSAYLASFKNYLFGYRTPSFPSRLVWSAITDPTSWPVNNFIDIDKDHGFGAGMIAFGNELILFKTRSMHKLVGEIFDPANPTYAIYPIAVPASFRFGSGFSPTIHNGRLYFFCNNGIYEYRQGMGNITEVSQKWTKDLPDAFSVTTTGGSSSPIAESIYGISTNGCLLYRNLQYLTTGTDTQPPKMGLIDQHGAWWTAGDVTGGANLTQGTLPWAILTSASWNKPKVVYPDSKHLYSYEINPYFTAAVPVTNYHSTAAASLPIPAEWRSREFNIELGVFKKLVIYLKKQTAGSISLDWSIDQGSFVTNTVDMTVGRGNMIRRVLDINTKGSTIQLRITNSTASQNFEIYAIKIFYEPTEDERLT